MEFTGFSPEQIKGYKKMIREQGAEGKTIYEVMSIIKKDVETLTGEHISAYDPRIKELRWYAQNKCKRLHFDATYIIITETDAYITTCTDYELKSIEKIDHIKVKPEYAERLLNMVRK
jgi:hypothetical protein